MARTARGVVAVPTRPVVVAVRGIMVGSIEKRPHQMIVRVVGVDLCGVRNEVVGAIDHTLGPGAVEEAAPIAVVSGVGNDQSRGERPRHGVIRIGY